MIEDLRKGLTSNEAPRPMYGLRPDETHEPLHQKPVGVGFKHHDDEIAVVAI